MIRAMTVTLTMEELIAEESVFERNIEPNDYLAEGLRRSLLNKESAEEGKSARG